MLSLLAVRPSLQSKTQFGLRERREQRGGRQGQSLGLRNKSLGLGVWGLGLEDFWFRGRELHGGRRGQSLHLGFRSEAEGLRL